MRSPSVGLGKAGLGSMAKTGTGAAGGSGIPIAADAARSPHSRIRGVFDLLLFRPRRRAFGAFPCGAAEPVGGFAHAGTAFSHRAGIAARNAVFRSRHLPRECCKIGLEGSGQRTMKTVFRGFQIGASRCVLQRVVHSRTEFAALGFRGPGSIFNNRKSEKMSRFAARKKI